ncbi:MAG TPA: hypothetical protein VLF66_03785 [Thermoanaerobaculia bacterium]|nr:hypothetical protein [Thermoanaerobaculia bacterium]
MRLRTLLLGLAVVAGAAAGEPVPALGQESREDPFLGRDPRSIVVLRFECASDLGRREVTLFGNGTVRLWEGAPGEEEMSLGELAPEALDGTLARLAAEDLSEVPPKVHGVEGDWVERCVLELPWLVERPGAAGGATPAYRFSRYGSLPLALSRVVALAMELTEVAEGERAPGLPPGYEPRRGDVLVRTDGARFRVVELTADGKGVELEGLEQPLVLYLAPDAIPEVFVAVDSREPE